MNVSVPAGQSRRQRTAQHLLAASAVLGALICLTIGFVRYLGVIHKSVFYPFGLDYGEGVVWAQMHQIVSGQAYGPVDTYPALVFHYPPLYHLLTNALADGFAMDGLAAGRLLSAVATFATATAICLIAAHVAKSQGAGSSRWLCGLIAGLTIFSMMPVLHWSRFMRVDMLALAFSFAGLYFGLHALSRPKLIHAAALCFVAAIFTKQTSLAPPLAVFGTLLFIRPRVALAGAATGMIIASLALALALWQFGFGFVEHLVVYNINTVQWGRLQWVIPMLIQHMLFIIAALFGVASWARCRIVRSRNPEDRVEVGARAGRTTSDEQMIILCAYFFSATIMLLTIVKAGSAYNYFMEWLCIVALLGGVAMRRAVSFNGNAEAQAGVAILVPVAIAMQSLILPDTPQDSGNRSASRSAELHRLVRIVSSATKPVISNDLVLLIRSGKEPQWEPFTFPELAAKGLWDNRDFMAKVRRHDFAFFLSDGDDADAISRGYSPEVAAAITSHYPVTRSMGGMTISMPTASQSAKVSCTSHEFLTCSAGS